MSTEAISSSEINATAENAIARKNMWLYLLCQALGGASAPINIALGGLVGIHLLGDDKSLATAPVTAYNIGVAVGAIIANAIMRRVGRKSRVHDRNCDRYCRNDPLWPCYHC